MKIYTKILSIVLAFFIFPICTCAATVSSESDISDIDVPLSQTVTNAAIGENLDIKAKSAILMDVSSGEILYEMNADAVTAPASITKIMSLLLVMEAIERGEISLEDVVTTSQHAASMGGSQIWLEEGESMTVDEMLKATVIASANDATVALGEKIAGSEEGFVAQMNQRAQDLGMSNTLFKNATGLDAEGHISSAHDVALMSAELIKHELIKNYSTVWMDSLRNGESELVNTNKLVRFYEGTTGLKTGTTSQAGYCLSATAERDGLSLVAVIMDGETSNDRFNGAKKLLDYGFANFAYTLVEPEIKEGEIKLLHGTQKTIKIEKPQSFGTLLKKSERGEITQQINLPKEIEAPVKKGKKVGSVDFFLGDTQIGSVDITAAQEGEKMRFGIAFLWILKGVLKA